MPYNPGGQTGPPGAPGPTAVIQDEGVPLAGAPHTTLNFAGAGVTATDAGFGVALITIPGGGSVAEPADQIVFGTGASVTSDPDLTYVQAVNGNDGRFFLNTLTGIGPIPSVSTTQATPGRVAIFGVRGVQAAIALGGRVDIWGGYATVGTVSGTGGAVNIWGGNTGGGPAPQVGGAVNIIGGDTPGTANTTGGKVDIIGGSGRGGGAVDVDGGPGPGGTGGNLNLRGGDGDTGGETRLEGGDGSVNEGGRIFILAGISAGGNGASVAIEGSDAGGATSGGGQVSLQSGDGGATSGTAGSLLLYAGAAPGSGDGGLAELRGGASVSGNGGHVSIQSGDGVVDGSIKLVIPATGDLQINTDPGAAGEVLTSQGAAVPPVWAAPPSMLSAGGFDIGAAANTRLLPFGFDSTAVNADDPKGVVVPFAGVIDRLYARHNTAAGNGNVVAYTLRVNGVATALTVSLATGAIGQASDLVNTVTVAQGDFIEMRAVKAVAIGSGALEVFTSMRFRPSAV